MPTVATCSDNFQNACKFNEVDPTRAKTALCLFDGSKYYNDCIYNDELVGLAPGDPYDKYYTIGACGCCENDDDIAAEIAGGVSLKYAGEDYCEGPLCTPDDAGWQVCDASGKGGVKSINVCVDNVDLCVNPFDSVDVGTSIECGECVLGLCAAWCAGNNKPWSTKCNWINCEGCGSCPVDDVGVCAAWCAGNDQPWSTKCNWINCEGCDPCGTCATWCAGNSQPWSTKCSWLNCIGCGECSP